MLTSRLLSFTDAVFCLKSLLYRGAFCGATGTLCFGPWMTLSIGFKVTAHRFFVACVQCSPESSLATGTGNRTRIAHPRVWYQCASLTRAIKYVYKIQRFFTPNNFALCITHIEMLWSYKSTQTDKQELWLIKSIICDDSVWRDDKAWM